MNSFWNKNIAAFSNRFPALHKLYASLINEISESKKAPEELFPFWKVTESKSGAVTAEEGGVRLHSGYNPQREAQQTASQIIEANKQNVVFLGLGLGYQVIEYCRLSNNAEQRLVLIEPDPLYFFAALYYSDWSQVFQKEQLVIALECPSDAVFSILENSSQVNLGNSGVSSSYFIKIAAFMAHNQPYFNAINELIERNKTKNQINAATYDKFAKLWLNNTMNNLCQLQKHRTVAQFLQAEKNSLSGFPFVIAAAGPGLEECIPLLAEQKDRIVIVCVETALHALLRQGIQPDFIVITDPQFYAYCHIAGLDAPQSTLICPLTVKPAVFRMNVKEVLICSDLYPVNTFFEALPGSFGDLGAGGSVASSAWSFAVLYGAKEIYFAGLDLGYPSKQTHIKGSSAEQTFHKLNTRLSSVEKFSCGSMYSAVPEYSVSYSGNKLLTDSRMKMFAWWFESKISSVPEVKCYSLNKNSLKIPGVEYIEKINLSGTAAKPALQSNIQPLLSESLLKTAFAEYKSALKELYETVCRAVEQCIIDSSNKEVFADLENRLKQNRLYPVINLIMPSQTQLESQSENMRSQFLYTTIQKKLRPFVDSAAAVSLN